MTLLRAFIAIEFPASLQESIFRQTARTRQNAGSEAARWVTQANLHLTLKFLGDVSQANLQFLNQMLSVEAAKYPSFLLTVGGLGAFPSTRRPRVIWVGVQVPQELRALQHSIETAAARLGYAPEERPFSPHLTIGRVRQSASPADQQRLRLAIESTQIGQIGQAEIGSVTLMKSDLQPGGSVYTPLYSAKLASLSNPEVKSEST
jgi:2'-5' RNA ligase